MLYFLDSAKLDLIEKTIKTYEIDGVTTNPIILARDIEEGMTLKKLLLKIRELTTGKKLFVQVTSDKADEMAEDARKIVSTLGGDLSIKVPLNSEGIEAIKLLKKEGISTTATACYTTSQALLAAKAGADFVAPYISHIDNLSEDGPVKAGEMARQLYEQGFSTQVLAASFRTAAQVERCIAEGVTSVTITAEMFDILSSHPGMLMYGKEASNRKQEIDRQHYTIPNQRPKDKHCGKI